MFGAPSTPFGQQNTGGSAFGGFGQQQQQSTGFGQPQQSAGFGFGTQNNNNTQQSGGFGSSGFGSTTASTGFGSSGFGAPAPSAFGQPAPSAPSGGLFGSSAPGETTENDSYVSTSEKESSHPHSKQPQHLVKHLHLGRNQAAVFLVVVLQVVLSELLHKYFINISILIVQNQPLHLVSPLRPVAGFLEAEHLVSTIVRLPKLECVRFVL